MKRLVILCRHGNTFEAGQPAFMVGAREDLPLTEEGRAQGARIGEALKAYSSLVTSVWAGPLRRTSEFAACIASAAPLSRDIVIDRRLIELDYGNWSGLTNEEIARVSGQDALSAWQERGVRPSGINFAPDAKTLREETLAVLQDLANLQGLSVVVSSNGRLREFGRVLSDTAEGSFKVRTGGACVLEYQAQVWRIVSWDSTPAELAQLLAQNLS